MVSNSNGSILASCYSFSWKQTYIAFFELKYHQIICLKVVDRNRIIISSRLASPEGHWRITSELVKTIYCTLNEDNIGVYCYFWADSLGSLSETEVNFLLNRTRLKLTLTRQFRPSWAMDFLEWLHPAAKSHSWTLSYLEG